jgi:hypothetical protein
LYAALNSGSFFHSSTIFLWDFVGSVFFMTLLSPFADDERDQAQTYFFAIVIDYPRHIYS